MMKAGENCRPRLELLDVHLVCDLCKGYIIDATTIVECMHTFCRSCIVLYFRKCQFCPTCDVLAHNSKPLLSLRSDTLLQELIYRIVPGLYKSEMSRRRLFFSRLPRVMWPVDRGESSGQGRRLVLAADDTVSVCLRYCSQHCDLITLPDRFLQCRGSVCVSHLHHLLYSKTVTLLPHNGRSQWRVQIMTARDLCSLSETLSLTELAYSLHWNQTTPLLLLYRLVLADSSSLQCISHSSPLSADDSESVCWDSGQAHLQKSPVVQIQIAENGSVVFTKQCDCNTQHLLDNTAISAPSIEHTAVNSLRDCDGIMTSSCDNVVMTSLCDGNGGSDSVALPVDKSSPLKVPALPAISPVNGGGNAAPLTCVSRFVGDSDGKTAASSTTAVSFTASGSVSISAGVCANNSRNKSNLNARISGNRAKNSGRVRLRTHCGRSGNRCASASRALARANGSSWRHLVPFSAVKGLPRVWSQQLSLALHSATVLPSTVTLSSSLLECADSISSSSLMFATTHSNLQIPLLLKMPPSLVLPPPSLIASPPSLLSQLSLLSSSLSPSSPSSSSAQILSTVSSPIYRHLYMNQPVSQTAVVSNFSAVAPPSPGVCSLINNVVCSVLPPTATTAICTANYSTTQQMRSHK